MVSVKKMFLSNSNKFEKNFQIKKLECIFYVFLESETSEDISPEYESVSSKTTSITTQSLNKEVINNQLIVLEPNNPVMMRFQNALRQHLLKQRENVKEELLTLVSYTTILLNIIIIAYI